jgi:hypothetical protein
MDTSRQVFLHITLQVACTGYNEMILYVICIITSMQKECDVTNLLHGVESSLKS